MKSLRRLAHRILDRTLIPFLGYVGCRVSIAMPPRTVLQELADRTAADCADYVQEEMPRALQFHRREGLWDYAWEKKKATGLIAEFGVFGGYSINRLASKTGQTVYGFDSFVGLQEDWSGADRAKGNFDLDGNLPKVAKNVQLVKGWFDETLPQFLAEHQDDFAFVHVDCDTYEATRTLFDLTELRIQEGTVIVFDEYFGYRGWRCGEHKAWLEFVSRNAIRYEYLRFSTGQVAVRVTQRKESTQPSR